nr:MAG TPA: hypothetical protein [Caudoviricetes sp.]
MKLKHMTTDQFMESVEALGLRPEQNENYGKKYIDIKDKFGEIIAYVVVDVQGMMNVRNVTAGYDHDLFFKTICAYASTPVNKREPKTYKLKILGADPQLSLYLIHINEYETTVTTNKKAAKAYSESGVYDAKELAEKQGFTLKAEVINVDD